MDNDYAKFLKEMGLTEAMMTQALKDMPEPLPKKPWEAFVIHDSPIHGKGIFSTVDAKPGTILAMLWVNGKWTDAGRYANHSGEPNCYAYRVGDTIMLEAYTDVDEGDELVVDYRDISDAINDEGKRFRVVDNFSPDINAVINSAKNAGFATWLPEKGKVGSSVYEGMGFWGEHAAMLRALIFHLGEVVVPNNMFFRVTNEDTERAYIHSDRTTGNHTCVCYLSDHDDEYGTAFYRHKPTGLYEMPSFENMKLLGIEEELKEDMVNRDPEKWEQVGFVQGKFNRAVIFDAPLFHSRLPVHGFGDSEESGRLIWASHFYKLRGDGALF